MAPLVPDPPPDCRDPLIETRPEGEEWWHVWSAGRAPSCTAFNPGYGRGRFHPISDDHGDAIPTYYAATSEDAAIFESVFHDIREAAADQQIYRKDYEGRVLSKVRLSREVSLVDLATLGRHRLRVSRAELIEPVGRHHYLRTARWAEYFLRCTPDIDGLIWPARRFDSARAMVLFDAASDPVEDVGDSRPLDGGAGLDRVLSLAEDADILVVIR